MSKINKILAKWLPGDVHTLRWFEANEVSQRVAYSYSKTGATRKIGSGVFALPDDELSWLGAVRAMQEELSLPIHVSARKALELQGASHNVAQARRPRVTIVASARMRVPTWVRGNDWDVDLAFKQSTLIIGEQELVDFTVSGITIKLAAREQAILELIDGLDLSKNFEAAQNHLSSLMTLRPKTMQDLLERCSSAKVKRVFLFLAEKLELPFFRKLKLDDVDLGSGKRVVVKGGRYDAKYQITVPREDNEASVGF